MVVRADPLFTFRTLPVIATFELSRTDGVATQAWTDRDRTVWQLSTATGALSRDGEVLGDSQEALAAHGVSASDPALTRQVKAAMAASHDLDAYLYPGAAANPFASHDGRALATARECAITPDIACSTSLICAAMGGDWSCGLFVTRCCF